LGSGRQYFPWIHAADLVGLILHCLHTPTISGPINAVAPTPTTNAEFTRALARVVGRPAFLPAPKFGLQMAFGEFGKSLFDNQRIEAKVAVSSGYSFQYSTVDAALQDLIA
jgi:NAD dependent epimerase/dehydratase family enzyme